MVPAPDGQGAREGNDRSVLVQVCALIAHMVKRFHSGVQLVQETDEQSLPDRHVRHILGSV